MRPCDGFIGSQSGCFAWCFAAKATAPRWFNPIRSRVAEIARVLMSRVYEEAGWVEIAEGIGNLHRAEAQPRHACRGGCSSLIRVTTDRAARACSPGPDQVHASATYTRSLGAYGF